MLVNNNRIQSLTDLIALPVFIICFALNLYTSDRMRHGVTIQIPFHQASPTSCQTKKNRACGYPNQELCKQVLTIEIICRLLFMPPSHNGLKSLFFSFCYFKPIKSVSHFDRHFFVEFKNLQQTPFIRIEC